MAAMRGARSWHASEWNTKHPGNHSVYNIRRLPRTASDPPRSLQTCSFNGASVRFGSDAEEWSKYRSMASLRRFEAGSADDNVPPLKLFALVSDLTLKTPALNPASETCSPAPPAAPAPPRGSEPPRGQGPGATAGRPSRGAAVIPVEAMLEGRRLCYQNLCSGQSRLAVSAQISRVDAESVTLCSRRWCFQPCQAWCIRRIIAPLCLSVWHILIFAIFEYICKL